MCGGQKKLPDPWGGGLDPKMDTRVPHDITRAVGAGAKKRKKPYPYGCKISKKFPLWVENL